MVKVQTIMGLCTIERKFPQNLSIKIIGKVLLKV